MQVYVHLHEGPGGFRSVLRPPDTPAKALQDWIDDAWTEYRRQYPHASRGTLAADILIYLKLLVNRPALRRARTFQLAWWCDRFGHRSRHALQPHELETALNERLAAGAAPSTVKKYRTALYHLFTKLDGRNAPNPLRDVPPPRERSPTRSSTLFSATCRRNGISKRSTRPARHSSMPKPALHAPTGARSHARMA
jgi:hypothetical protein